jgi:putative membrane protein
MTFPLLSALFAMIAGLLHVYIFVLESVRWRHPSAWRKFGITSQEHADIIRPMAFNQGFYNLFLAAGVIVGLALSGTLVGYGMIVLALAIMVLAAVVLVVTNRTLWVAALVQGLPPLLALVTILMAEP